MTLWDPVQQYTLSFEQDGDDVVVDMKVEPGGGVPAHVHPRQVETFEMLSGELRFLRGAEHVTAGPGDVVVVPAGVKHNFENHGNVQAHGRCRVSPGLKLIAFFEETSQAARDGLYNRALIPLKPRALPVLAGVLVRYADEVEMSYPPKPLQALIKPLARFDRRSGRPNGA